MAVHEYGLWWVWRGDRRQERYGSGTTPRPDKCGSGMIPHRRVTPYPEKEWPHAAWSETGRNSAGRLGGGPHNIAVPVVGE